MFNKNDRVIIYNTNDIWENKKGIVVSDNSESEDITVKVFFDETKKTIQKFPKDNIKLDLTNEILLEDVSISNIDDFINHFVGKKCIFTGLDYNEIYTKKEHNGEFNYDSADLEEINYYKMLEKIPCEIISCAIIDSFDPKVSTKNNFNRCYWDIEFMNSDILSGISGEHLHLKNDILENIIISENINSNDDVDFIKDYVFSETLDDDKKVASWFFVKKIAQAENLSEQEVLKCAKKHNYKIFRITAPLFNKLVVAASKCSGDKIYNDYAEYIQGPVTVKEEK